MIFDTLTFNFTIVSNYIKTFCLDIKDYSSNLYDFFDIIKNYYDLVEIQFPISDSISDFQFSILKTFLIILVVNLLVIIICWRKYGQSISDRFIRPSTLKEIEELKLSVARLKLPKEHSWRL